MEENKKSMTQNFIDNWLDGASCNYGELCLTEISKEQYNELYETKMRTEYFYEQDLLKEYDDIVFIIDEKDSKLFERAKKQSDDIYFMVENLEFLQVGFVIESDL